MKKVDIENAWFDFLRAALPEKWEIIFSEQNDNRPRLPYLTIKIVSGGGKQTIDSDIRAEKTGDETVHYLVSQRNYALSLQTYGPEGMDALADVLASLDDYDLHEILRGADIGGINPGQPADITAILPTKFEERCSLDILFHSSHNKIVNIGTIEKVEIAGEIVSNEDKTIHTNQTIEG